MNYTLTRSRRKTLALYVRPDGSVEVRAPNRLSKPAIERFVASKADWIKRKQEQLAARAPVPVREMPPAEYAPGEFEQAACEYVRKWEERLGVTATYIGFRKMSSRWGSCTKKTGRIRLNTMLIYCPEECLEYLVVHELAHLRECNHSPRFWAIICDALPDYKSRQKKLKDLSWLLAAAASGTPTIPILDS